MDKLSQDLPFLGRIDLAREPKFALGGLAARPSSCEVVFEGERRVLQRRVMQVFVALACSPNEVVSQSELISRCWSGLSVTDDAIGRCIGQLRRLAASWREPPFTIETLPGLGYRIDPRGLRAEPEVRAAAISPRALRAAIAAATGLAVVALATWWLLGGPAASPGAGGRFPNVVVRAFQPADGSAAARAYAASLTGAVSDAASHYDLVVIRPSLANGDAGAASATGADFVLDGRLARKGGAQVITSELVDARRGVVIYSFDTPAPAGSASSAAAEIAGRMAHALDPSKFTNDLGGKLSPLDYTLVARANEAIDRWDMVDALGLTQTLAQRHPDDADLKASTALAAAFAAQQAPPAGRPALIRLARRSVAEAERLNAPSALLHDARQLLLSGPLTWAAQEAELRQAVKLDPNLHVSFNALGELMLSVGRTKEGVSLITRSIQLDPMSEVVIGSGLRDFVEAGATDEANDALARFATLWPDQTDAARSFRRLIALYLGAPRDALANANPQPGVYAEVGLPPAQREAMNETLVSGEPSKLRRMIGECFANYGRSTDQFADRECLLEMVERGALDDAFRFAEIAYPDNRRLYPPGADGWLVNPPLGLDPAWLFTPRMKPFRDDPRFWDVAVRTGLAAYWRSTGAWPDDCQHQLAMCQSRAAAAVARDRPLDPGGSP
ncbi:MAG TPA: winged helix-turn-helix domain-containing protein [Caulobacteraceae bacterium]|nr:winged helix-turn-helix domain-containing protein [Caulobacteraceae bacterium]